MPATLKELFDLDREISATERHVRELKQEREATLAGIRSANIKDQNGYHLFEKVREIRYADPEKFFQKFPTIFSSIVKVELKKADDALGKNVVDSCCEIQKSVSYRVIETENHDDGN